MGAKETTSNFHAFENEPITTFMIAQDSYLKEFVRNFTEANKGKAFLGSFDTTIFITQDVLG